MGVETASYITQLVDTNPVVGDPVGEGDDHIRMVKTVLKNSFPSTSTAAVIPNVSGQSGKYLTTNGTDTSWGALSSGKVLQFLSMTGPSEIYSTSATFADTGLTLAITPSATSSKVFVLAQIKTTGQDNSSDRGGKVGLQILKSSSIIYGPIESAIYVGGPSSVNRQSQNWTQLQYLDSPSTTSATTYKLQFNCNDDGAWANTDRDWET